MPPMREHKIAWYRSEGMTPTSPLSSRGTSGIRLTHGDRRWRDWSTRAGDHSAWLGTGRGRFELSGGGQSSRRTSRFRAVRPWRASVSHHGREIPPADLDPSRTTESPKRQEWHRGHPERRRAPAAADSLFQVTVRGCSAGARLPEQAPQPHHLRRHRQRPRTRPVSVPAGEEAVEGYGEASVGRRWASGHRENTPQCSPGRAPRSRNPTE